jgi:short-subunit dehydrogenase
MAVALVTGASSGIGAAFARALAARGYDLVLVARRLDRLEALATELEAAHGRRAIALSQDLSAPDSADALAQAVADLNLTVDLLVNNAGIGWYEAFAAMDRAQVMATVNLNVATLTALTHAFLPGMVARGQGAVIQVASAAAFQPIPFGAVYAASKAYVLSFSEAIAEEVAPQGVRVVCLCPGTTESEIHSYSGVKPGLLELAPPMPAEAVVQEALRALAWRQRVVVPGLQNALGAFAARVLPRDLLTHITGRIFAPQKSEDRAST